MWNVIFYIWMIVFAAIATINLFYGNGRKWTFTWTHFVWFILGMIFVAIPYQYLLHMSN